MREPARDITRLEHIFEAIENIRTYAKGKSFDDLSSDKMCLHAIIYNFTIIGEAANMLSHEYIELHPETPWRQIIGMRNFLVHDYQNVEVSVVWNVLENELPLFAQQIEDGIKELAAIGRVE